MRFAVAAFVSIIFAVVGLPLARVRAYFSWKKWMPLICGVVYVALAGLAGVVAALAATAGADAKDGTLTMVAAGAQGFTGHAVLRMPGRPDASGTGRRHLLDVLRGQLFQLLDSSVDEKMIGAIEKLTGPELTAVVVDLLYMAERRATLTDRRRRELLELRTAHDHYAGGQGMESLCLLRSVLRAECLEQGITKARFESLGKNAASG